MCTELTKAAGNTEHPTNSKGTDQTNEDSNRLTTTNTDTVTLTTSPPTMPHAC